MRYLLLRLKRFCGFTTGLVFFIGGLLKVLDPVGAGLVMKEYLEFLHIGFLGFASKPLGLLFALAETIIGTGLITGVWRKAIGVIAISFQAFFTFLTILLVIFNPSMDCGCFGEAIHLTHMQTFVKNLILCALLAIYFFPAKWIGKPKKEKYISFSIVTMSVLAFASYSLTYIPLVDFTAYKPAAELKASHNFTSDEEMYESFFVYEKNGVEETFDLYHLPDSTWTYVRTDVKVKEGHNEHELLDLSFSNAEGEYMDDLAANGRVLIVSVYDPDMSVRKWKRITRFISDAESTGYKALLLVSGTEDQLEKEFSKIDIKTSNILKNHLYYSDYKTLIAMNRSNGGATYFSDGYLVRKGAHSALPDKETLEEVHEEDITETIIRQSTRGSLAFQGFLLYVFAIMLLL